jgi:hypothetical protein
VESISLPFPFAICISGSGIYNKPIHISPTIRSSGSYGYMEKRVRSSAKAGPVVPSKAPPEYRRGALLFKVQNFYTPLALPKSKIFKQFFSTVQRFRELSPPADMRRVSFVYCNASSSPPPLIF